MLVTQPHHHTVTVCLLAPFLLVHSCFPPQCLTTYPTLAWVPIELSSCSNYGRVDSVSFTGLLPYYSWSVSGTTGRRRRAESDQPLSGKICELDEQREGQSSTERAQEQAEQNSFPGPSGPESNHRHVLSAPSSERTHQKPPSTLMAVTPDVSPQPFLLSHPTLSPL